MNDRAPLPRNVRIAAGVLLFLGAVSLVAVYFLPRVYFAKVTMQVKADSSGLIMVFGGSPRQHDDEFIAAQFSILRSQEILIQVIKSLLLNEKWSKDGLPLAMERAYSRLVSSLELRDLGSDGLIEIGVYDHDPQEAANIANKIAVVYQQKRLSDLQRNIEKGMEQLAAEVEKQRQRADSSAVEMEKTRVRVGVIDPNPSDYSSQGTLVPEREGGMSIEEKARIGEYTEAKVRFLQTKRIYESAKTKYATESLERGVDFDLAKIWEKAEPPVRPIGFSFRRLRLAFTR